MMKEKNDDKPEIIINRFKSYNAETQQLIPFYETKGIMFNINGMQEVEKVSLEITLIISLT